ncbi:Large neutral amino acids transporter small subunit 4 [Trichoplax sp. H2]|nr:Large neutral amino acids transporter small subunit 4 [Trichoplax sp. H2]|eukprot:RDD43028.1 Large neutral amino acids transporter small subunit 4 [Trichoplax sp. H2]
MNKFFTKLFTFKWLEDSLVDVVKWRYALVAMGVLEALLFCGITFGWANLVYVLKAEGFWIELCPELNVTFHAHEMISSNITCLPQSEILQAVFTVSVFVPNAVLVIIGFSIDRFGPRNMRFIASILLMSSFLMLALATRDSPSLLFPALSLCSTAGMYFLLSLFQIGNLFKTKRSTVISIINGSFDASAAIFLFFQLIYDVGISRSTLFLIWTALSFITVINTIVFIPAKPILPPDAEYNSITSGILGNYYYIFHALEVVNVSLLGIHSKTINHMNKPSQNVSRRSRLFDSVSVSYDMTEYFKEDLADSDQIKRSCSYLSVSHSINLSDSYPPSDIVKEDSDPSIINYEILEPKSIDNETIIRSSYAQSMNLPVINIQDTDNMTTKVGFENENHRDFGSKDQKFSDLNAHRLSRRSLSVDADPLYLVNPKDVLANLQGRQQSTETNDFEVDSLARDGRVALPNSESNNCFECEEENNDAISIHSLTIDPFERQPTRDNANDQKSLPASPAGSNGSAASSVSAYNLNALFFEDNFTDYTIQESHPTNDLNVQAQNYTAPLQSVSVTITNAEDGNIANADDSGDEKSDNGSVSSVVLANKFFKEQLNHNNNRSSVSNGASNTGYRSCPQSPTGSVVSNGSTISAYNLNALLFGSNKANKKSKRMTVDDGALLKSTSKHTQTTSHGGFHSKIKAKSQPASPVGSNSSACSSISAYHLNSLFDNEKFREKFSNTEVDKSGITEWITNQEQYLPLRQKQSDPNDNTTANSENKDIDNQAIKAKDLKQDSTDESYCRTEAWLSNNQLQGLEDINQTSQQTEVGLINTHQNNDNQKVVAKIQENYNMSGDGISEEDLKNLSSLANSDRELKSSPFTLRKATISTIAEEQDSYAIPDITVTRANSEEDLRTESCQESDDQHGAIGHRTRSNTLAQLLRQDSKESSRRRSYIPTRRDSNFAANDDIELPQLKLPRCMTDSRANYSRYNIYSLGNAFAVPATHTARLKTISEANRKREMRQRARKFRSDSVKSNTDSNHNPKLQREVSRKKRSIRRIRSDSSLSVKSDYMLNWKAAIRSPLFICHCLYLGLIQLRLVFFIGSLYSFLDYLTDSQPDVVTAYTNAFGWVQMFGMIASIGIGLLMDFKLSESNPVEVVQMTSSAIAYFIINTMTVLFGIVTVIPVLELQYISFLLHTIIRAFIYSANSSFIAIAFPIEHHSTLIGVSLFVAALFSLLQFPLFILIRVNLGGDPFWINIALFIVSIIAYGYPFLIWHESKKLEAAMTDTDDDAISTIEYNRSASTEPIA